MSDLANALCAFVDVNYSNKYTHFYRPQTELREGYVFTGVCDFVHRGACMVVGGVHGCGGACVVVGVCMVAGGMHGWGMCAWLQGACVVVGGCAWLLGGMHGCRGVEGLAWLWGGGRWCAWLRRACMFAGGMHGWGDMHGCWEGGMVGGGRGHAWLQGQHVWLQGDMRGCGEVCMVAGGVHGCWGVCRIRRDTVNEWAVRILLECILVARVILINPYLKNPNCDTSLK